MRKNLILLPLLLLLFIITPLTAWAIMPLESRPENGVYILPDHPYPRQTGINILGQNHSYSVLFRGNGEAIVTARFIFSNLTETTQTNYRLRFPRVKPSDIIIYQQVRRGKCLISRSPIPLTIPESSCAAYTSEDDCNQANYSESEEVRIYNPSCQWLHCANACLPFGISKSVACGQPVCADWEEPDYFTYNNYGNNEYKKLQFTQRGDEIEIQLKNPIQAQKTGALLFTYRAFGYAVKNILGGYNFTFETAKIPDKIYNLQVGISVDTDLLLRQETGIINYYPESGSGVSMMAPIVEKGAVSSSQLNDYYNQVGLGAVTKTANNLQPSESFTVKGSYGAKTYQLYSREIFLGLAVLIIILFIIYLIVKFLYRFYQKFLHVSQQNLKAGRPVTIGRSRKITTLPWPMPQTVIPLIESLAASFVSSLFIFGSLIFYFLVFPVLRYNIFAGPSSYNYYQLHPFQILMSLLIIVCLILVDLAVLTGSVVLIWKRRGYLFGLFTLILNIFWLAFYLIIVFLIFYLLSGRTYFYDYPTPVPLQPPSVIQPEMMRGGPSQ